MGRFDIETFSPTKMDKKWNWYDTYYFLSGKLNMSVIEVSKLRWLKTLEWLTFFEERRKIEENINKRNKKR